MTALSVRPAAPIRGGHRPRADCDARALFHSLLHREHHPRVLPLAYRTLSAWLERADAAGSPCATPPVEALSPAHHRELVRQYSPCGLLEFSWLEGLSHTAINHSAIASGLFDLFRAAPWRRAAYRRLLDAIDPTVPDVRTWLFCRHTDIADEAFQSALVRLCLAAFPRRFLAETIGFTQAHVQETATVAALVKAAEEALGERRPGGTGACPEACGAQIVEAVAARFLDDAASASEQNRRRLGMQRGRALYALLDGEWYAGFSRKCRHGSLAEQTARLVRRKARYAAGNHKGLMLGGMSLDRWFSEEPFRSDAFLAALARSPYVDRERPEASRLLGAMGADGTMYGVFTGAERRLVLDWIRSGFPVAEGEQRVAPSPPRPPERDRGAPTAAQPHDRRTLFHRLINSDRYPAVQIAARRLVQGHLSGACVDMGRRDTPLGPVEFDPDAFASRIDAIYRAEVDRYRPFTPPPKLSREFLRWAIMQFAPAILVDGCWLQHIARTPIQDPVNERLFRIFSDEIGNGQPREHHGNVYRALLAQLDIALPDVTTPEFAAHRGFLDRAFDLPNYLLAISQFPETFLPELIGLNLAIELSGLGAVYLGLVDTLAYWGIDSKIVRLHLSIDNLDTGHAALARDIVILHLERARALGGAEDVAVHWRRILTGYRSLRTVPRGFLWRLGRHYVFGRVSHAVRTLLGRP